MSVEHEQNWMDFKEDITSSSRPQSLVTLMEELAEMRNTLDARGLLIPRGNPRRLAPSTAAQSAASNRTNSETNSASILDNVSVCSSHARSEDGENVSHDLSDAFLGSDK